MSSREHDHHDGPFTAIATMLVAGVFFWAPDVLVLQVITGKETWRLRTLVCPLGLLIFYAVATRLRRGHPGGPSIAMFSLIGVLVEGPWVMTVVSNLRVNILHYLNPVDYGLLLFESIFPPLEFWYAGMHGSLFGIVLISIIMPFCHSLFERKRWIVSPRVKARICRISH